MIPSACKRLAEVDFPIKEVSKHSAREKSIRHGHPSTLHLWWARRPLAACRSILLGLLLPDPADPLCPGDFKAKARELLPRLTGPIGADELDLRKALLKFIADFANWDNSANPLFLEVGRGLVKAAHSEETPLVVDPFAGGGSIPLEALRLGCDAFASDLNPVACLILKVMLEDIPRHGPELAEELRKVGAEIKEEAEKELREFYPIDPDGAKPIAYLWARTVRCESPNCGAEIPLMRSFWLCKKPKRRKALCPYIQQNEGKTPQVEFEIFEPKAESEVHNGTVARAKATCLYCGTVLAPERVRAQLAMQKGGADVIFNEKGERIGGARMTAVVTIKDDAPGRFYRLPNSDDYQAVFKAHQRLELIKEEKLPNGLSPVPDETIPFSEIRRISVPLYGLKTWGDIFTQRQKLSLLYHSKFIKTFKSTNILNVLSLSFDRYLMLSSAHCRWKPTGESLIDIFGRHAIGMVWDFTESSPFIDNDTIQNSWISKHIEYIKYYTDLIKIGITSQNSAHKINLPTNSAHIWFTDPPYYDSVPYSHLSDFFYVWLKRILSDSDYKHLFESFLTPKDYECVVDRPHTLSKSNKDFNHYLTLFKETSLEGRRIVSKTGLASIVFAHKTTEGWEALIEGIISSDWCIVASWPISTELSSRLNARDNASLESSIHLILRPRPADAPSGDWSGVLRELPGRVSEWMFRLQSEGIRGADLVFACIGPALEIFSRYSKVETPEGREIKLAEYLEKVWEVVGRSALEQVLGSSEAAARNGMAGALEEDARLTALFLWTMQSSNENGNGKTEKEAETEDDDEIEDEEEKPVKKKGGYSLIFDVVRRFAQPLGISLPVWEGRVIETEKGVVRLLSVSERAKQLFGEEDARAIASHFELGAKDSQELNLFPNGETNTVPKIKTLRAIKSGHSSHLDADSVRKKEATTLDKVHAAMLLQKGGQTNALRALLKTEVSRSSDFLRLANALSALYPKNSEEKRLLDGMLLAVPK